MADHGVRVGEGGVCAEDVCYDELEPPRLPCFCRVVERFEG